MFPLRALWISRAPEDGKMLKKSKVTEETAAGQAGKCRMKDVPPPVRGGGGTIKVLYCSCLHQVFLLIQGMMMNRINLTTPKKHLQERETVQEDGDIKDYIWPVQKMHLCLKTCNTQDIWILLYYADGRPFLLKINVIHDVKKTTAEMWFFCDTDAAVFLFFFAAWEKNITSSKKFGCGTTSLINFSFPAIVIVKMSVKWMITGIADARRWDAKKMWWLKETMLWRTSWWQKQMSRQIIFLVHLIENADI